MTQKPIVTIEPTGTYPMPLGDFLQEGPPQKGEYLSSEYVSHTRQVCVYESDTMKATVLQDIRYGWVIVLFPWIFGDDALDADLRAKNYKRVRKVFQAETSGEAILNAMGWLLDIDRALSNLHYSTDL